MIKSKTKTFSTFAVLTLILVLIPQTNAELVSHYTFDTNTTDSQGVRNGFIVGNGSITTNAKIGGGALNLWGGYVDLPGSVAQLNNLTQVTVAAWVNVHSDNNFVEGIFATDTCCNDPTSLHIYWYETYLGGGPHLDGQSWGGGYVSSTAVPGLPPTGWFHFAYVRDDLKLTMYINGIPTATAFGGTQANLGGDAAIGSWRGTERFFDGQIDDLRIYNHALTEWEIGGLPGINGSLPPANIEGDINRDDCVNITDLMELASRWLVVGCANPRWCEGTDINESGFVDFADFSFVSGNWGKCLLELHELHNMGFVVVSPHGPADGGDFGKYTPGTQTSGLQEAFNYAITQQKDVFIIGGGFAVTGGSPVMYWVDTTIYVPPTENLRIVGGDYHMYFRMSDADGIVFDSQKNCEFKFGLLGPVLTNGNALVRIRPQNPRPDGLIGVSNSSFHINAVVGGGNVFGEGFEGVGTGCHLDALQGPIENNRILIMEINACNTGLLLERGNIFNNIIECPFDHITNHPVIVKTGSYNIFDVMIQGGGVGSPGIGVDIQAGAQNTYQIKDLGGYGTNTLVIGANARKNIIRTMSVGLGEIINNATVSDNQIMMESPAGFALGTPAFPASGVYLENRTCFTVAVRIKSAGNISSWALKDSNGNERLMNAGLRAGQEIYLNPGDWIKFNYSASPSWRWKAM